MILHKSIYTLLLLILLCISTACNYTKNIFESNPPQDSFIENTFDDNELYVLRITEAPQVIDGEGNVSEIPFVRFRQVQDKKDTTQQIIEEVYLHLGNISNKNTSSGPALYFVTYPFINKATRLLYNNTKYISTYSFRKIYVGKWEKNSNQVNIELKNKKEYLRISGIIDIATNNLKIEKIDHPKPDKHSKYSRADLMVPIDKVFYLGDEKGLVFLNNYYERKLIHPDWSELDGSLDIQKLGKNHIMVLGQEEITTFYLKKSRNDTLGYVFPLTFRIETKASQLDQSVKYITYNP